MITANEDMIAQLLFMIIDQGRKSVIYDQRHLMESVQRAKLDGKLTKQAAQRTNLNFYRTSLVNHRTIIPCPRTNHFSHRTNTSA